MKNEENEINNKIKNSRLKYLKTITYNNFITNYNSNCMGNCNREYINCGICYCPKFYCFLPI